MNGIIIFFNNTIHDALKSCFGTQTGAASVPVLNENIKLLLPSIVMRQMRLVPLRK